MKSEIESLIQAGRKLVESNVVSDPHDFSNRLDMLKSLYNSVSRFNARSWKYLSFYWARFIILSCVRLVGH